MVLLSFSCEEKKEALLNRECSQTIRPVRKNEIKEGDELQIYWTVRVPPERKDIHKIGEGVVTRTLKLEFYEPAFKDTLKLGAYIEEVRARDWLRSWVAEEDGFDSWKELSGWFMDKYGEDLYDIKFKVIRWDWKGE